MASGLAGPKVMAATRRRRRPAFEDNVVIRATPGGQMAAVAGPSGEVMARVRGTMPLA